MSEMNQLCLFLLFKSNFYNFNKKSRVQILSYSNKASMEQFTYRF